MQLALTFETAEHREWQAQRSSTKVCPDCGGKCKRIHHRYGPMSADLAVMKQAQIIPPRVSSARTWWNVGPIRWLIAPPEPPAPEQWYLVVIKTVCKKCGSSMERDEYRGRRQFGRIRRFLFLLRKPIDAILDKVLPNH